MSTKQAYYVRRKEAAIIEQEGCEGPALSRPRAGPMTKQEGPLPRSLAKHRVAALNRHFKAEPAIVGATTGS